MSLELTEYINDPHTICSVLKSYLRELPEPLMTRALHSDWKKIAKLVLRVFDAKRCPIYYMQPRKRGSVVRTLTSTISCCDVALIEKL